MDTSFDRSKTGKDEWLTPLEIIRALGEFDLDPYSPVKRPWDTAKKHYNYNDNGLLLPWDGRVWCNPPYGNHTGDWLEKCVAHGDCVALIFARTETRMFFDYVWNVADAVLFLKGRICFYNSDGTKANGNAGAPSVLVAYGKNNASALLDCGLNGKFVNLKNNLLPVNHLVEMLKKTLSAGSDINVQFNNKKDEMDFILDICNSFKKQLLLDKGKKIS